MFFKCTSILISICWILNLSMCQKSFTIVLDTTKSMIEEIDIIKANIASVVNFVENHTVIEDYILVPFKDPDVGPSITKLTSKDFINSLSTLNISGGHDCPENSLAAIKTALQISKPESYIFLFTDAFAKDHSLFNSIENLCKNSNSKVVIFLSGQCLPRRATVSGEADVYYNVANVCSGAVFRLEVQQLRQAFRYIKEITRLDWNDVIDYDDFAFFDQIPLTVDTFTKQFMITLSCLHPEVNLCLNGRNVKIEKIIDTRLSQAINVIDPDVGDYQVTMTCQGKSSSAKLYVKKDIPLMYGFSTRKPTHLKETSARPIPGWTNYLLLHLLNSSIRIKTIEIQQLGSNKGDTLSIEEIYNSGTYSYQTHVFIEPGKLIRIVIKAQDTSNNKEISFTTKYLSPQRAVTNPTRVKPTAEIIIPESTILIDYSTNTTLACKITGYPKPNIRWEDNTGLVLPSEDVLVEIPSIYISYAVIHGIKNCTIYCKCENSIGKAIHSIDIYVNRTFSIEVVQRPQDITIEYGGEGKLYCQVNAYPDADIRWYHNNEHIKPNEDILIITENGLHIKNMTMELTGQYKCEISNYVETKYFSAIVNISGIEMPQLQVESSEIVLTPGNWTKLECRIVKGKPNPQITWSYQNEHGYKQEKLPDGLFINNSKLTIPSVETKHRGIYTCKAKNVLGEDSKDITVKVQYSPKIHNSELATKIVKEGDAVELICDVDASPEATVRWEMYQADVIFNLDNRHSVDNRHTLRFSALGNDSGNYICVAENGIGKAEKTIQLNVFVPPYIKSPELDTMRIKGGSNVEFKCNVVYGNPTPTTKWEFIATDYTTTVLARGNTTNDLHLTDVTKANEGSYLCIADNEIGTDRIIYQLNVI